MTDDSTHYAGISRDRVEPVVWNEIGEDRTPRGMVTKLSCVFDGLPGLLLVERCNLGMSAESALARLRMEHRRYADLADVMALDDVDTPLGTFVRRAFLSTPRRQRTVISGAAEVEDGNDVIVQFAVAGTDHDVARLDALWSLSIDKILEISDADDPTREDASPESSLQPPTTGQV